MQVCHGRGVLLLVDEAHGAHLGLHPAMPPSAMHAGADVAVQSTHKTLASLTQTSMLHVGRAAPAGLAAAIARHLSIFHSTSPSYLLMASLELAAHAAADPRTFDEPLQAAMHVRHAWWCCGGQTLCMADTGGDSAAPAERREAEPESVVAYEPLRVTLLATGTGLSGFDLSVALQRLQVVPEMASENTVVLALGSGSTLADAIAAAGALKTVWHAGGDRNAATLSKDAPYARDDPSAVAIAAGPQAHVWQRGLHDSSGDLGHRAIGDAGLRTFVAARSKALSESPSGMGATLGDRYKTGGQVKMAGVLRGALAAEVEEVRPAAAAGRRSGALISVYPPGVPLLLYGEVITAEALGTLRAAVVAGARLTGCRSDGAHLPVLRECMHGNASG